MLKRPRWWQRVRWSRLLIAYLALLVASNVVMMVWPWNPLSGADKLPTSAQTYQVKVPAVDGGKTTSDEVTLNVIKFGASTDVPLRDVPVFLLHGSPSGGGADFRSYAPLLNAAGYDVYAPDFPGFGASSKLVPDYSLVANALYTRAVMDKLMIGRAHVVGWSQGGGSAIVLADAAPERVASLTLLASIGVQEAEGSGNYYFEHAKYAMGFVFALGMPEFMPHFGRLGTRAFRFAFIRNFWDSDQRPLRAVMERLDVPTLILQGRRDPLVPAWAAEESHALIKNSRLVMFDAGHFLPLAGGMQSESVTREVAQAQLAFLMRHDVADAEPLAGAAIFAPAAENEDEAKIGTFHITRDTPWWLGILIIILATFISEDLTVIAVGLLVVSGNIDWGVGLMGCFLGIVIGDYGLWALGRFAGRRMLDWPFVRRFVSEKAVEKWGRVLDRHPAKTVFLSRCLPGTRTPTYIAAGMLARKSHVFLFWVTMAVFFWTPILMVLTAVIGPQILEVMKTVFHGPWAYLVAFLVLFIIVRIASYEATHSGRQRLKADLAKLRRVEFWPMSVFYAPLLPYLLYLGARNRGLMTFTCMNPGIPAGGGVVGESKMHILTGLSHSGAATLPAVLVRGGRKHQERTAEALEAIRENEALGGFPVILKPDHSERGHGLKLARNEEDVADYFRDMTRDALVQKFHPGPNECGILWTRVPQNGLALDECDGEIFSITRKTFAEIEGDGKRTLEELIWDHPRYRMQADIFLKRYEDQTDRVLGAGEKMRLGVAGNHCQGTMFTDGADLITPELSSVINAIARNFRDERTGGRLDYGRFDVRYSSDEELRRGVGLAIIELNGTMSESTNMYDPSKSALWTYRVLFRQWAVMFRLGALRRREGRGHMRLRTLIGAARAHFKGRPGSSVAD